MKKSFMREKVIHCGKDYLAPEIFPYTGTQQQAVKGKRGKKKRVSEPKQKNLNDRRAKRYFIQLANSNFGEGDLAVHLTYAPEFLPDTYPFQSGYAGGTGVWERDRRVEIRGGF